MKLVGRRLLEAFSQKHEDVQGHIQAWAEEVEDATWQSPLEVKERYRSASFIGDKEVVFNLKGTKYRLHAKIDYTAQVVFAKRIGTHAEYTKWKF